MTDLNPTPNNKLVVGGITGYGNIIAGVAAIAAGLMFAIEPLAWIGVFLVVAGIVLVAAQLIQRRQRERQR